MGTDEHGFIRQFCHEKDCNESRLVKWNYEFLNKWICDKHMKKHE